MGEDQSTSMTTSTYVSQFDALTKKAESFVQSLRSAKIHPSKDQYTTFKAFSLRLCDAAAAIPVEIEALKKRQAESCEEGRKLISQAQLGRNDLTHLKNRGVFARNMKLFFGGPQDSAIDSDTIKARKRLTRERCDRICKLNPDVLSALGDEDPLRGSHKYQEFLKGKSDFSEKVSKKLNYQLLRTKKKRRRVRISQGNAGVLQIDLHRRLNPCHPCRIVNWLLRFQLASMPPG